MHNKTYKWGIILAFWRDILTCYRYNYFYYLKFLKQNLKSSINQEYPAVLYAEFSQSGPAES